ncbi:HIT-like domain-containing protein [Phaeosphaeriaceae sp. PMI808]|nr:HIT-like domain-containing protein [Phaeosphaeriaceae sp. PMI808]
MDDDVLVVVIPEKPDYGQTIGDMPLTKDAIKFGSFVVTSQVFHLSRYSFAIVNLKPLLPGHVLVSPRRVVPRFNDLSTAEVQDLFLTVQRVSRMVERVFDASSLNIAIQDGLDAGQSVPHVHAHIIPRRTDDLKEHGGIDAIYAMMESDDAHLGNQLKERDSAQDEKRGKFPAVDNDSRKPRTNQEMQHEAEWLAAEMAKDDHGT